MKLYKQKDPPVDIYCPHCRHLMGGITPAGKNVCYNCRLVFVIDFEEW